MGIFSKVVRKFIKIDAVRVLRKSNLKDTLRAQELAYKQIAKNAKVSNMASTTTLNRVAKLSAAGDRAVKSQRRGVIQLEAAATGSVLAGVGASVAASKQRKKKSNKLADGYKYVYGKIRRVK